MNWTRIDATTEATEIKGAGCFVRFFGHPGATFAPSTTIKLDEKGKGSLVAVNNCLTQIMFTGGTGETTTSSFHWVGDAGEKLDKKLAKLAKQRGEPEPEVGITMTTFPGPAPKPTRGKAKVNRKKFRAMKFDRVKRKRVGRKVITERTHK